MANPNIYAQIQTAAPVNRLAELAGVMQVQGMQQDREMGMLKADEYRRGVERKNRLQELLAGGADEQKLARAGYLDEAKALGDSRRANAKSDAETESKRTETALKVLGAGRDAVFNARDPQEATAYINAIFDHPSLKGSGLAAMRDGFLPRVETPEQFDAWKKQFAMGASDFIKANAPKITTQDLGGTSRIVATPGLGGAPTVLDESRITQSENNRATVNASLANAAATRDVAAATRDAARISADAKRSQDTEMKLADDYRTESKGFAETSTAMKKVLAAIETADKNPGSALSAGTGFMKLLDPNSVVRETELGMALNASGWFDRATNIANTLQNGRVMTAEQKKNLRSAAETLFEEAKAAQREVDAAYERRAKDYKLEPKRIITDRGQNAAKASAVQSVPKDVADILGKYGAGGK